MEEVSDERRCDRTCFSCNDRGARIFCLGPIRREEPALDGESGPFPCPQKDAGEHHPVEAAGVGVTQRWVVGGEKMQAVR